MAFKIEFSMNRPGFLGKLPLIGTVLGRKVTDNGLNRAKSVFNERHTVNTNPSTGRLIKNPSVYRAVRPKIKRFLIGTGEFSVDITGSKKTVGIVYQNELGTKGHGGVFPSIVPKKSKVLTVPNTRKGIPPRAQAREYPNAVWVPRGRDTTRPMLVELAPPKRKVGPNHKQPNRWMVPSRKIVRVIMFGVPKVDIRPKHFIEDAFVHTVNTLKAEFPELVQRSLRETIQ